MLRDNLLLRSPLVAAQKECTAVGSWQAQLQLFKGFGLAGSPLRSQLEISQLCYPLNKELIPPEHSAAQINYSQVYSKSVMTYDFLLICLQEEYFKAIRYHRDGAWECVAHVSFSES